LIALLTPVVTFPFLGPAYFNPGTPEGIGGSGMLGGGPGIGGIDGGPDVGTAGKCERLTAPPLELLFSELRDDDRASLLSKENRLDSLASPAVAVPSGFELGPAAGSAVV